MILFDAIAFATGRFPPDMFDLKQKRRTFSKRSTFECLEKREEARSSLLGKSSNHLRGRLPVFRAER